MPVPREEALVVEDRAWPLLILRLPPNTAEETMRMMIRAIERAYERRQRFAVIVDTTAVQRFPSAPVRQVLTDWVADLKRAERDRSYTVATVVVLSSGPLRALTAAINLIRRPVSPQHWTATLAEGFDRARQCLLEEGIALTARGEALYAEITAAPDQRRGA
jgi:hypothetical protein